MQIFCKYDELVDPKSLKDHPKNRNKHGQDQIERLAELYKYHGVRHPIIVSNLTGFVVAGHGRKLAAIRAGIKEFPVVYQDFETSEAEYAFIQADNAIASWSELDLSGINADIGDLGPDFDINMLGIKDFTIDVADKDPGCDEDEVPEEVEPTCKLGQIWKLGDHRLMCGDSTDVSMVELLMDGQKADMVFTDPPYGFNYSQKSTGNTIENDGEEFSEIVKMAISNIDAKEYFICGDFRTAGELIPKISFLGRPKSCIVWIKPIQHRMHKFEMCHEFVWYFGENGGPFYGENVFKAKREIEKIHPTIKPIELIVYCLNSSKQKNIVDLFGGSGSTLIACENTNRKCFMMELDPHYCDVILQRWSKYTGKTPELLNE